MFTVLRPIIKNVLMAYFFGHSHYGTLYCQDRQRHRATTRATTTASPSSKTHAQFRAFHRAFRARKSYPFHHQARQTRTACRSISSNSYHFPRQKCHTAFKPKLSVYAYQQLPPSGEQLYIVTECQYYLYNMLAWCGILLHIYLSVIRQQPLRYTAMVKHIPLRSNILTYRTL